MAEKSPDIALKLRFNRATITFNDTPHLIFMIDQFVGLQTWKTADRHVLEMTLSRGVITAEYNTLEKLCGVLAKIEEALP